MFALCEIASALPYILGNSTRLEVICFSLGWFGCWDAYVAMLTMLGKWLEENGYPLLLAMSIEFSRLKHTMVDPLQQMVLDQS